MTLVDRASTQELGRHKPSVHDTPFCTNSCAVWSPTVSQHRGSAGKRLPWRGGEGRQAPASGHCACCRGLGAEPRLPGLHGEPSAGPVPAQSPLLGQPASTQPPLGPGGSGPGHLLAVNSCPRLPAPRGYLHALWGQEQAGCCRAQTQGVGPRRLWGHRLGLAPPLLLRFVNHVSSSSRKGATALPAS